MNCNTFISILHENLSYDNNNGIIIPIYWYWVKITPVIYPIYAGLERICPRDTKNVSYVDVGHV